jgi:CheY-like chemotaxis protein
MPNEPKKPGARILICEDEIMLAKARIRAMGNLDYEVAAMVAPGDEVVRMAEEFKPDLILMDAKLEGEGEGTEASAEISSCFDIPAVSPQGVVWTGHSLSPQERDLLGPRAKGFADNPYQTKQHMEIAKGVLDAK